MNETAEIASKGQFSVAAGFDTLAPHLDVIEELAYDSRDVDFYAGFVADGSSAEYGVGGGRVARVVRPTYAVDSSQASLAYAQAHQPAGTTFLHDDLAVATLPNPVDYSYAAGRTINCILSVARLTEVLRAIRRNSRDSSLFAFDVLGDRAHSGILQTVGQVRTAVETNDVSLRVRYDEHVDRTFLQRLWVERAGSPAVELGPIIERHHAEEELARACEESGWRVIAVVDGSEAGFWNEVGLATLWVCEAVAPPTNATTG